MVVISRAGYIITDIDVDKPAVRSHAATLLEMSLDAIEKGGHKHFMLKEIMEQVRPPVVREALFRAQHLLLRLSPAARCLAQLHPWARQH